MRHVNYHDWARYLIQLFSQADIPITNVLDIACGTGSLMLSLFDFGINVAGFDESEGMIKVAKNKACKKDLRLPIWRGSMFCFAVRRPVHAIVCTYDSLNYCLDKSQCESVFYHAAKAISPGGVMIFDVCTEKNSLRNFRTYYEKESTKEFNYIRQSYYVKKRRLQVNEFYIKWNSGSAPLFQEIHYQRIYRIDELLALVPTRYFKIVGVYDGFTTNSGCEDSERVHFVLKKYDSQIT
jgi:SAM-dependent methyltransferase